jgi:phosphoribosylformylglycinamidine (FGAM) synthase-like amidotransferase family enzyme
MAEVPIETMFWIATVKLIGPLATQHDFHALRGLSRNKVNRYICRFRQWRVTNPRQMFKRRYEVIRV